MDDRQQPPEQPDPPEEQAAAATEDAASASPGDEAPHEAEGGPSPEGEIGHAAEGAATAGASGAASGASASQVAESAGSAAAAPALDGVESATGVASPQSIPTTGAEAAQAGATAAAEEAGSLGAPAAATQQAPALLSAWAPVAAQAAGGAAAAASGASGRAPASGSSATSSSGASSSAGGGAPSSASEAAHEVAGWLGSEVPPVRCSFEPAEDVGTDWDATSAHCTESLNHPYELTLDLQTDDTNAEPSALLGVSVLFTMERLDVEVRFPGIVASVSEGAVGGGRVATRIKVVPALWALSQRKNSRIFQDKTVPEILDEVLKAGLDPYNRTYEANLSRTYPKCEYRTQYAETDLDFVHRLMAEEGIVYWFDADGDEEVMYLGDAPDAHQDVSTWGGSSVPVVTYEGGGDGRDRITSLSRTDSLTTTKVRVRHFDWTSPQEPVEVDGETVPQSDGRPDGAAVGPEREQYIHDDSLRTLSEYDEGSGAYGQHDADAQLQLAREKLATMALQVTGTSTALGIRAGQILEVERHPQPELDGRYLVVDVEHGALGASGGQTYQNTFHAIPADIPFRPVLKAAKPRIPGVQTAKVVGPSGQEIHTDQHGRIRVQFHWDREGQLDEHSSCYLRVLQPWGGPGWGFVFLPRIGMEVVVSFVDGDPDRPMVMGSVYNGENHPPFTLPDDQNISTIRSRSTPGGGDDEYNEIHFKDTRGEEVFNVQAQRDLTELVKNDHSTTVQGNQTNTVSGDHSESVSGKQTVTVSKTRSVTVEGSQSVTIQGGEAADGVTGSKLDITGDWVADASNEVKFQAPTKITLTCGSSTITMEPSKITLNAGGGSELVLDANALMKSSQGSQAKLDANAEVKSAPGASMKLDSNATVGSVAGSQMKLDANAELTGSANAKVGAGAMTTVEGPAGVTVNGGGVVKADPSGVTLSGAMINASGSGVVSISGPLVKVN